MIRLPADDVVPDVVRALQDHGSCVLVAPTGAGKTTRVPPALPGRVVLLEPRRVAARAAARRIGQERGWSLGKEVGWHVRLDRKASADTRVLACTTGILLARLQSDPFLDDVDVVVFDEFHERSWQADLALALVRQAQLARDGLQVLVMSATLDPGPVAAFLDDAPVVHSEGRLHPIALDWKADDRPVHVRTAAGVRWMAERVEGDVLAFLPGVADIRRTAGLLQDLNPRPLYGDLPLAEQDAVLKPSSRRRVVLATNVAEASVTVPGVEGVVDTGLAKVLRFHPGNGLNRLRTERISKASADQRMGRAGRQQPGRCLRLWSDNERLVPRTEPEIRRVDLAPAVLQLRGWGERDPHAFPWFEAPDAPALDVAVALLERLDADSLPALPLHPRLARLVVDGARLGVRREACIAAALLEERDIFARSRRPPTTESDLQDRVDAVLAGDHPRIARIARELARHLDGGSRGGPDALRRAALAAWPDRVARRRGASDRARMVNGRGVRLADTSGVREAELFVCLDLDDTDVREARVRIASAVDREWLSTETSVDVEWDDDKLRAIRRVRHGDLVLEERPAKLDASEAAAALEDHALATGFVPDDPLLLRVACLREWMPELGLPSTEELVAGMLPGVCRGRRSLAQLRKADWPIKRALGSFVPLVERHAPERLQLPSGPRIRLTYEPGRPPVLAARMQQLFGWHDTPTVADGRVRVLLHLLAPNMRPQQITDDLAGFWENTWPEVRKELRGRYPKHAWPEKP